MERTLFFSDWVNEYKPIEFNEVELVRAPETDIILPVEHIANRIGFNIISKYLTSNREFPMGHISAVYIMNKCRPTSTSPFTWTSRIWSPNTGLWTLDPKADFMVTYACSHRLVTRKPIIDRGVNYRDEIIIDFSKESIEYNKFKIMLIYYRAG